MNDKPATQANPTLSEAEVVAFLKRHPEFLREHPELLEVLTPPERELGGNVADFQYYAMSSLQDHMRDLKGQFDGLIGSARDNMSVQAQVHRAILHLLEARGLEQLLEALTIECMQVFDVDAVRLVVESDMAELYASTYGEESYSGISFVPRQTVDFSIGPDKPALLISDARRDPPYAHEAIFVDCSALIQSCALLRLRLETIGRDGILAFGVREKGRFNPHQATDLLTFMAEVVALRLDDNLRGSEYEKLLV